MDAIQFGLLLHIASHGPCTAGPIRLPETDAMFADLAAQGLITVSQDGEMQITEAGLDALDA